MTSPYAPHTESDVNEMLASIGLDEIDELFDIPQDLRYSGEFTIDAKSEQTVKTETRQLLSRNSDLTELLGRGHYDHYIPSVVDSLSQRSEFLTSYTQYQPEIAQGFLQALFEYQSLLVELTGLEIANCSMYDAATALGEAGLLSARVNQASGDCILVPDIIREERKAVLRSYIKGTEITLQEYPTRDANVDPQLLADQVGDDVLMIYAETPTSRGTIEEHLDAVGSIAEDNNALFCLGSDPIALAILEEPASVGADIVIGDASVLGLPQSYGTGLGLFVTRDDFLRQLPGRLVGVSSDTQDRRSFTLTLQTREQHIRRERATSNICTNQAWVALRTAIHAAWLGPDGLIELANTCVRLPDQVASRINDFDGITAPAHDRSHFREFVAQVEQPAQEVVSTLLESGFAVHQVGEHEIQICITDVTEQHIDEFVSSLEEVV
ncbi:MAG: aminomethyl-transferring glycine dehydrogenase subunit GcvPA [Halobacteriaceae archaeon]